MGKLWAARMALTFSFFCVAHTQRSDKALDMTRSTF